jgi:hypothetical protein
MEKGLVNLVSCMPKDEQCRTYQALGYRNHGIAACWCDELYLKARWRSQHASDDDAAAHYSRAWQIRCPDGRNQVREGR